MCSDSESGSYSRLIDTSISQLLSQEPSWTCNESEEEEEEEEEGSRVRSIGFGVHERWFQAPADLCPEVVG